eukprot:maker-scaffold205_size259573-snap-gene-1.42 protein:Tk01395 transcript:maker-scaffold205_size259573-snap-gene-1.42-mRNA-1 annotation:"serine palmitoyltransferase 2"
MTRESSDHGWTFRLNPAETKEVVNLVSYNYLGYAENAGPCTEAAISTLGELGITSSSPRSELGTTRLHHELEQTVADFIGAEDSLCLGMGFATNSLNLPCLAGKGTLVVVALKKKYGAYLYLDEAHSVGAMGPNGRGVVDYFGLDPKDIDILMGTFTKSFGSVGGYIAGSHTLIRRLRAHSQASVYPTSMSPPVMSQIIASMRDIMDQKNGDGMRRIRQLALNSRYFRQRLQQLGFIVYGHDHSPVVPVMLFMQAKITGFVHELYERNIATIGVGYPATDIAAERTRFCVSASHTKEMLDECLAAIDEVGSHLHIKYSRKQRYNNAEIAY